MHAGHVAPQRNALHIVRHARHIVVVREPHLEGVCVSGSGVRV